MNKTKRINWVDWAKALGIFLVVIGHMVYPAYLNFLQKIIYSFHMPFFILISGYLFNPGKYTIKKDVKGLLIPYVLFNLIVLAVFYVPWNFSYERMPFFIQILKNTFLGLQYPPILAFWFLLALFWAKWIAHYLLKLSCLPGMLLSVIIASAGYFMGVDVEVFNLHFKIPFFLSQGLLAVPFFMIGYYSCKYKLVDYLFSKKRFLILSCVILLPLYSILVYTLDMLSFVDCFLTNIPLAGILMILIGCYLFLLFCRLFNRFENHYIQRISVGTIVVLALHQQIYKTYLAIFPSFGFLRGFIFCCLMMLFFYYLIGFIQEYFPILMGGRKKLLGKQNGGN